jgi:protein-S-isoprenylcysteine O-methyltransferase Ste14
LYPLFSSSSPATAIFCAAGLVWMVPEMIGMFGQRAKVSRKAAIFQDRGSMVILIGLQWTGLALNFALVGWLPAAAITWQPAIFFAVGIICMLLGVGMRWAAIRTLGKYFTRDVAVSADQPVVQHGLYRVIRHPAYSGTILTMLGLGLATGNWAGWICLLACVFLGHFYRVIIEEQALIRTIGQPYIDYMRRTRRFIPLLF